VISFWAFLSKINRTKYRFFEDEIETCITNTELSWNLGERKKQNSEKRQQNQYENGEKSKSWTHPLEVDWKIMSWKVTVLEGYRENGRGWISK
jgi:hypothetical protein